MPLPTMNAVKLTVTCDRCLSAHCAVSGADVDAAHTRLAAAGWRRSLEGGDFCPPCATEATREQWRRP